MAAVEDGEILELDNHQPIHLCPEAPPTPPHIHQSPSDVSPPRVNPYRGGDPFLGAQQPPDHVLNPATSFARFRTSSLPYRHTHTRSASLSDLNSQLHSPGPPEEPRFERDPYATNITSPSAKQQSIPKPSNISHPHSFQVSNSSNDPRAASLPTLPSLSPSHRHTWPNSATPDASPSTFRGPSGAQILNPQNYNHDPEAYSPTHDPSLFSNGPVYHAEPAPPSLYYARQHPLVPPINTGPHRTAFDVQRRGPPHPIHPPHEGVSGTMFNQELYVSGMAKKPVFPSSDPLNQANGFATVGISYQPIHEVDSPRHRLVETKVQEEDDVHHQRRVLAPGLDVSSRDPSPYNQQYKASSHQRRISEMFVTEDVTRDEDDGERGRMHQEQRMSSFSDEEDQHTNPAEARSSGNGHHGGHISEHDDDGSVSQPKASEKKNGSLSQDEASDGEISSSRVVSPVMSLATVPDESPSPPSSTKKKPAKSDAKKHLSELRRKALMSVKKRPAPRSNNGSVEPTSPCLNPPAAPATNPEAVEGPQIVQGTQVDKNADDGGNITGSPDRPSNSGDEHAPGFRMHLDSTVQRVVGGVRRTMTRKQFAEWQAWPYQNRVLVDYSSDSSDSDGSDAGDVNDCGDDAGADFAGEVRRSAHRNRESEIEAMKIRMIRLGKCPSMLFGGSKSSNETKNSSSALSAEKPEDGAVRERDDKTAAKKSALSQAQSELLGTVRQEGQGQQNANAVDISSPKRSNALVLKVSDLNGAQEQSNSARNDKNGTPVPGQKAPTLRLAENRSVLELGKVSEHMSGSAGGISKSTTMQEGKAGSQLQNGETGNQRKESLLPMKTSRSAAGAAGANTASPIAELKRRIAAIEKTRDSLKQQRYKKQKTVANQEIRANDRTETDVEQKRLQHSTIGGTEVLRKKRMSKTYKVEQGRGGRRYYSSGTSDTMQEKRLALGVYDKTNEDMDIDAECQESGSDVAETKKSSIGEKQDMETAFRLPDDNAERRYIDDLRLELEQKTKELMNERDRTEQLRIAEMAIAEAQAKLNFTRTRVSALQDELQKAERDVLDAEKECRQRARVVAQLRLANTDNSTDIVPGQEEPISAVQLAEGMDSSVRSTGPDIATESDREEDVRQEEGKMADFVLRPSPYSPSAGDNFTSCLRALRAYLLRIPHHSKARDRSAGGILSSTWGVDLDPMKAICPQELRGQCSNKACEFQHLKVFKAPKDRALQVIHVIETFFSRDDKQKEEKSIINARIAIHEGKDATKTLSSLISALCASSEAIPYSCAAD